MIGTAAVVVTYNRKELVARCIRAVLRQTVQVERIYIVDNASTDQTAEYLRDAGLLDDTIVEYVRMGSNTGSAGGFHEGMKRSFDAGHEWLWMMDDDGYPATDCLERLLACEGLDVIGPAVVRPDDHARLTWPLRVVHPSGRYKPMRSTGDDYAALVRRTPGGVYRGFAALFNGVLINRRVPAAIGYVLADLFIWGDENEYLLRCKAAGFEVGMCLAAIHYHATVVPRFSSRWKFYYLYRNAIYIARRYGRVSHALPLWPLYPIYISLKLMKDAPSKAPLYVLTLVQGAWRAWQGELVPFPEVAGSA